MISIQQYIYKCKYTIQHTGRLCCSGTNSFINFLTWGERHNSYYANHTIWPSMLTIPNAPHILWYLRSLSVEIWKTQQHFQRSKSNSQLTLFKIVKFSGPSLPSMTSSTLQTHFLSGGLLWQWWLSYPLHVSINCTNWLHTWTLNP